MNGGRTVEKSIRPSAVLFATACVLLAASSFRSSCLMKPSTVSGEMPSNSAVSSFAPHRFTAALALRIICVAVFRVASVGRSDGCAEGF
jgi:hypothetical protein